MRKSISSSYHSNLVESSRLPIQRITFLRPSPALPSKLSKTALLSPQIPTGTPLPSFLPRAKIIQRNMGTLVGHVVPGFGFFLVGLWHLLNNIKLHFLHPNTYTSPPWFPTSIHRYLELFLIMAGSCLSIAMELFIGPDRHQPLDPDWTIPSNHLHNFEHSFISFTFFTYAAFAILFDSLKLKARYELTQTLAALAFAQQFLLFHMHSADHVGMEGQYHLLLQVIVLVSLATTLMGIGRPRSFLIGFVRSLSILFQGIWFMVMGFVLWTPQLVPKGCFMNSEDGHFVVRCHAEIALDRAKSLVTIQFSWLLVCVAIFGMTLYLVLLKMYGEKAEYRALTKEGDDRDDENDLESQSLEKKGDEYQSLVHKGNSFGPMDIER